MKIKIIERTLNKSNNNSDFMIETISQNILLKELIFEKVKYEVEEINRKSKEDFDKRNVVESKIEKELNPKSNSSQFFSIDFETQYYKALDGFNKNKYFVLINQKQYFDLEATVTLENNLEILFLKVTPLVGG